MRVFNSIIISTIALVVILCASAFSDVVYFKDGGQIEGIITEEAEGSIVVDIGFGTMTIRRDEIGRIEKASPQRLEQLKKEKFSHEIETGEWAPDEYEEIRKLYRQAKDDRAALREARRKSQAIRSDISRNEARMSELLNMLDIKGRKLKGIEAKSDIKRYNDIVAEMNTINVHLNETNNKIKGLYESEKKTNEELTRLAGLYRSDFELFKNTWSDKRGAVKKGKVTSDEMYFFEEMDEKSKEMEGDFIRDIARYTPEGGHIFVDAVLNDKVTARLIVDTGASIVLLSTGVASQLGISYEDIAANIEMVMADGRTAEAKPIVLKSVRVGNAEIKSVQAAILEKEAIGGVDGLLGMSFLSNFVIKVDSTTNTLILERVM